MHRPAARRSIALLLLALTVLVGGLGAGLHALVDRYDGEFQCWLNGVACCPATRPAAVGAAPACRAGAPAVERACPVCVLLSRYHATPPGVATLPRSGFVAAWSAPTIRLPHVAPWRWPRPRGPPSSTAVGASHALRRRLC